MFYLQNLLNDILKSQLKPTGGNTHNKFSFIQV